MIISSPMFLNSSFVYFDVLEMFLSSQTVTYIYFEIVILFERLIHMSFETKFQILRPNYFLKYRIGNVFLKYVFIKNICYVTKIYKNNATLLLMLFLSLLMLWFVGSTHKYIDSRTTKPSRSYFYCFFCCCYFFMHSFPLPLRTSDL